MSKLYPNEQHNHSDLPLVNARRRIGEMLFRAEYNYGYSIISVFELFVITFLGELLR